MNRVPNHGLRATVTCGNTTAMIPLVDRAVKSSPCTASKVTAAGTMTVTPSWQSMDGAFPSLIVAGPGLMSKPGAIARAFAACSMTLLSLCSLCANAPLDPLCWRASHGAGNSLSRCKNGIRDCAMGFSSSRQDCDRKSG